MFFPVRAVSRFPDYAYSNANPKLTTNPEAFREFSRFARSVQAGAVPCNLVPEM